MKTTTRLATTGAPYTVTATPDDVGLRIDVDAGSTGTCSAHVVRAPGFMRGLDFIAGDGRPYGLQIQANGIAYQMAIHGRKFEAAVDHVLGEVRP